MNVLGVGNQTGATYAGVNAYQATLPKLSQVAYLAQDPFGAYLLSLSDPAAEALAAITNTTGNGNAATSNGAGAQASAETAAILAAGTALAANPEPAAEPATYAPAVATAAQAAGIPAEAAQALAGAAGTSAADTGTGFADTESAAAEDAARAARDGNATALDTDAQERQAALNSANATQANDLAANAIAAGTATAAADAANRSAMAGAVVGDQVSRDAGGLATDATAKYMGAGAMNIQAGGADPVRALAAYQAAQMEIPAVNRLNAAPALAAYSGNAQSQAFAQNPAAQTTTFIPAAHRAEGARIDLIA
jgi:hypothetical protein